MFSCPLYLRSANVNNEIRVVLVVELSNMPRALLTTVANESIIYVHYVTSG